LTKSDAENLRLRALAKAARHPTPAATAMALTAGTAEPWLPARHLDYLSNRLADAFLGTGSRYLLVDMPPRHGKSELCSRFFPVWALEWRPNLRVVVASYSETFAKEWGRKARESVQDDATRGTDRELTFEVDDRSQAVGEWRTGAGGSFISVGTKGSLTGRGVDLLIVDDPLKDREEADSPLIRRKVHRWWKATAAPRLEPNAVVVVIQTRWHEDDLIGYLAREQARQERELEDGLRDESDDFIRWERISLPAIAEEGRPDALEREPGEALWPERWSLDRLAIKRNAGGPHEWASLYQGRPQPPGDRMFHPAWFRYFRIDRLEQEDVFRFEEDGVEKRVPARECLWLAGADFAVKPGQENDFSAILVAALAPDARLFVVEVLRERLAIPDMLPTLESVLSRHRFVEVAFVEDAAGGSAVYQTARRKGLPVRGVIPRGSKPERGLLPSTYYSNGQIYHLEGARWVAEFEEELAEFPFGAFDDQADALFHLVANARDLAYGLLPD
jgi:predicted phage terminase large subunit-like protein